jgi:hypothetical protein
MLYIPKEDIQVPIPVPKLSADDRRPCYLCGEIFRINHMRNHVGMHILKAYRDITDPSIPSGEEVMSSII